MFALALSHSRSLGLLVLTTSIGSFLPSTSCAIQPPTNELEVATEKVDQPQVPEENAPKETDSAEKWNALSVLHLPEKTVAVTSLEQEYVLDLGELIGGRSYGVTVFVENGTTQPLILDEVSTSCGCLVGILPKTALKIKEKTDVRIIVAAPNKETPYGVKVTIFSKDKDALPLRLIVKASIRSPFEMLPDGKLAFIAMENEDPETKLRFVPFIEDVSILERKIKTVGRSEISSVNLDGNAIDLKFVSKNLTAQDFGSVQRVLIPYSDSRVPNVEFQWEQSLPIHIDGISAIFPETIIAREQNGVLLGRFILLASDREISKAGDNSKFTFNFRGKTIECKGSRLSNTKWIIRFEIPKDTALLDESAVDGEFEAGNIRLPFRIVTGV
jgi:Protein of unknown function (DUF1573)